jgi:hypothetical protein
LLKVEPKEGELYYFVKDLKVCFDIWKNSEVSDYELKMGNYFLSWEEAEDALNFTKLLLARRNQCEEEGNNGV